MEFRKLKSLNFLYEISKDGVLRNTKSKRIKKWQIDKDGYKRYKFNNKHIEVKNKAMHQLIMEAWGAKKPRWADCIDHINRNRADNRLENLRWATFSQNAKNTEFDRSKFSSEHKVWKYMTDANKKPVMLIGKDKIERTFESFYKAAEYLYSINTVETRTFEQIYHNICGNRNGYAYKHKIIKL